MLFYIGQILEAQFRQGAVFEIFADLRSNSTSNGLIEGGKGVERRLSSYRLAKGTLLLQVARESSTDLTKYVFEVDISELLAYILKTTRLNILYEIDGMVAYRHGATRLAVCC